MCFHFVERGFEWEYALVGRCDTLSVRHGDLYGLVFAGAGVTVKWECCSHEVVRGSCVRNGFVMVEVGFCFGGLQTFVRIFSSKHVDI